MMVEEESVFSVVDFREESNDCGGGELRLGFLKSSEVEHYLDIQNLKRMNWRIGHKEKIVWTNNCEGEEVETEVEGGYMYGGEGDRGLDFFNHELQNRKRHGIRKKLVC